MKRGRDCAWRVALWAVCCVQLGVAYDPYTAPDRATQWGATMVQELRAHRLLEEDDPVAVWYLETLAARLVAAAVRPGEVRPAPQIWWVRDPEPQAVTLPGSHMLVYAGVLQRLTTEAELAAIVAHEIGHWLHHHVALRIARHADQEALLLGALLATVALQTLTDPQAGGGMPAPLDDPVVARLPSVSAAPGICVAGMALSAAATLQFGRVQELEADQCALRILDAAGYGAGVLAQALGRLSAGVHGPDPLPAALRTHPLTADRIRRLQQADPSPSLGSADLRFLLIQIRLRQQAPDVQRAYYHAKIRATQDPVQALAGRYGLARALHGSGDVAEARTMLAALQADAPTEWIFAVDQAEHAAQSGDFRAAMQQIQSVLARGVPEAEQIVLWQILLAHALNAGDHGESARVIEALERAWLLSGRGNLLTLPAGLDRLKSRFYYETGDPLAGGLSQALCLWKSGKTGAARAALARVLADAPVDSRSHQMAVAQRTAWDRDTG